MTTHYEIIDSRTGKVACTRKTSAKAYDKADAMDAAFGAVRFIVRPVFA